MNAYIDARKVAGVVTEAGRLLADKGFTNIDIIIGLSELLGRLIVTTSHTPVQAKELREFAEKHLRATIRIGIDAEQKQGNQIITVN